MADEDDPAEHPVDHREDEVHPHGLPVLGPRPGPEGDEGQTHAEEEGAQHVAGGGEGALVAVWKHVKSKKNR